MTQEDHLDISHQPSNSVCDQVNDDSLIKSNSKNITTTNGNQKFSNDGISSIVRSNMGAAIVTESKENKLDSSSVSSSSSPDQLSSLPLPSIGNDKNQNQSIENNITVRDVVAVDTNSTEHTEEYQSLISKESVGINCDNENSSKMTVIKPQNNSENIREILQMKIENNDKNTDTNNNNNNNAQENHKLENENSDIEKKLKEVEHTTVTQEVKKENLESNKNEQSVNKLESEINSNVKSVESVSDIKGSKRKSRDRSISQDIEDPIARLNALKANISNALKEVKAVLIEHGEPVLPEKPEKQEKSVKDKDNTDDDGVVNFRFVKKIRRRSTFEEDKDAITEIVVKQIIDDNKIKEENETPSEFTERSEKTEQPNEIESKEKDANSREENQAEIDNKNDVQIIKEATIEKDENLKTNTENKIDTPKNVSLSEKNNQSITIGDISKNKVDSEKTDQTQKLNKKLSPKTKKVKSGEASVMSEDKKPVKTKKLVKRNSQDDTLKTAPTDVSSQASQKQLKSENNQKDSTIEESNTKKKPIKAVSDTKKIVKTAVSSALDKVLATTNLKIPNERRSSVATTKVSDQPNKPALEKRRSSTSRLILKNKQASTNEAEKTQNKFTNSKKLGDTSQTKSIEGRTSEVLSSENKNKTETLSEKIRTDQEAGKTSTSSPRNSLPSITDSEKENVAPSSAVALGDKKQELPITSTSASAVATKLEEKSQTKSETISVNENKTVNANSTNTSAKTALANGAIEVKKETTTSKTPESSESIKTPIVKNVDESAKPIVRDSIQKETIPQKSETPSPKIENVDQSTKQTVQAPTEKETLLQKRETPLQNSKISTEGQMEVSLQKSSPNATSVPAISTIKSKILPIKTQPVDTVSQPISNLPSSLQDSIKPNKDKLSSSTDLSQDTVKICENIASNSTTPSQESAKSSEAIEESITSNSTEVNQANSKFPLVRNAITAKLAELKRTPIKMPVVIKPNLEGAKIHPLMVLHITPPKNSSVTIVKKTPQQATVSTTEESKKSKTSKVNKNREDDEDIVISDHDDITENNDKTKAGGKRRKSKKVVIRRIKRRLSVDAEDKIPETEVEEKEIQPKTPEPESTEPEKIPGKKSCLKVRAYEPGELVLYADRIKKTIKWKKAKVLDKITSISYKLDIEGEEKPAHISYIKKYTDKKVHFGGKEYLEIDYAQDEDDEEEEEPERYNIWARV